ncbi:ABC transporter substrate-binding protein [Comamonas testosteroni]|uniref:ABC transporter substrate-binding protein n=1 Tax=Comamonas testosteroni TaxID=285 RepID=A0A373FHS5_COMTE|nr:helical backbone metal receptor [Comamonas testosteroni]RGE43721.1 ABC transporter substrate-binding protein [Comamonas testosteroni]
MPIKRGLLSFLVAAAGLVAGAQVQAAQITDARGVQVSLAQPPQRIVSLLPSLTESLCALDACKRLVGVDRYSNWPAHVKTVPVVGGGLDPNVEAIIALKPDLVLVSTASRAVARLEALGLKVVALEPRTHAEARVVMQKIGTLLQLPPAQGADKVWAAIEADMQRAADSVPVAMRGQRVYFEASRGPFAAGEHSFIGETLTRLHMRNVIEAKLGPFPRINPEYVVKADPDLLMAGERSWKSDVPEYPGWAQMRAVKQGAVCRFTPEQSDVLVRPGPRMAEAAHIMAQCLQRVAAKQGKAQ